jgi:hypothetical protein
LHNDLHNEVQRPKDPERYNASASNTLQCKQ